MTAGIHRRIPPFEVTEIIKQRFWMKVDIKGPDDCWNWLAGFRNGYGAIKIGVVRSAHRVAYVLAFGEPAEDLIIGHKCDNSACCNPAHLEAITAKKNNNDARSRIYHYVPRGEQIPSSVLKESDVHAICKLRKETGMGAVRMSRQLSLPLHAIRGILEKDTWLHISQQYDI